MQMLRFVWQVISLYRGRAMAVLGLQFLSAIADGLSIATLLPLLLIITGPDNAPKGSIAQKVAGLLASIGLPLNLPVLLGVIVVSVLVKSAFGFVAWRQIGYATAAVAADMRHRLLEALARARWSYFVDQPIGALNSAVGAQTIRAAGAFMLSCEVLTELIQVSIYLAITVILMPWMVVAGSALMAAVLFASTGRLKELRRESERRETAALDQLAIRISDSLRSFKTLKAMGVENAFVDLLHKETQEINLAQRLTVVSQAILRSSSEPMVAIALAIAIYVAVVQIKIPISELIFAALLFSRTVGRAVSLQKLSHNLAGMEVIFRNMDNLIAKTVAHADKPSGGRRTDMDGPIVFSDVSFNYGEARILDHVNAEIPPGRMVVIRGPSGAGKTTLVDLLIGLHHPTSGRISINGVPLDEADIRYWRSRIGYVPQESTMLQDTIANNMSLGRQDVHDADIKTALRRVEAWSFVSALPDGMQSLIGENGARLSGGQKQRLAIARALVHQPSLVILDEPTSALDSVTAVEIVRTLRRLVTEEGVTVLAITHHDIVAEYADVLYEMRGGNMRPVPERGAATITARVAHDV